MTRWLSAAKAALPPADKTDETDKTIPGCASSQTETTLSGVSSVMSVLSEGVVSPFPPQPGEIDAMPINADNFQQGHCRITGRPRTWTGRVVSLDEWRRLSAWDRHGSTGKLWNGITRQWEPDGGAA